MVDGKVVSPSGAPRVGRRYLSLTLIFHLVELKETFLTLCLMRGLKWESRLNAVKPVIQLKKQLCCLASPKANEGHTDLWIINRSPGLNKITK